MIVDRIYIKKAWQNKQHHHCGSVGADREGGTPVPIPNTEVKSFIADGTAWVTTWESRTVPTMLS